MIPPRRTPSLPLTLALVALAASSAVADAGESRLLSSCSGCWPLSSVHPRTMLVPDDAGGAYLAWVDGAFRVRVIRLCADLTPMPSWPAEGLVLAPDLQQWRQIHPVLASDGEGGVWVAWVEQDERSDLSVWLQRLRGEGGPASGWPTAGVRVSAPASWASHPVLAPLPDQGIAVAWFGVVGPDEAVRLLAFDARGQLASRWPAEGLLLGQGGPVSDAVELAADDRGGLFAAWAAGANQGADLLMAYASPFGVSSGHWTIATEALPFDAISLERHPEIVVEGRRGAIVVWTDVTRGERVRAMDLMDVLAQRISSRGRLEWEPAIGSGHVIAAGSGYQLEPHLIGDGSGGGYFSWNERGPGAPGGGHLAHLDAGGRPAAGWAATGILLGSEVSGLFSDLSGGVFATFFEGTVAMLQRVPRGWSPGQPQPAAVSLGNGVRQNLRLAADGRGGVFLAWEERAQAQVAVRIQHIEGQALAQSVASAPSTMQAPAPAFAVYPILPNPARTQCRIEFDLPVRTEVDIEVFDITGRRVTRLAKARSMDPGPQSVGWRLDDRDGRLVPAGLYLVRILAGSDRAVVRMAVTR